MTAFPRGNDDHGASVQLWLVIPNVVRNLGGGEISRCARNDRSELLVTDRSSLVPSGLRYCVSSRVTVQAAATDRKSTTSELQSLMRISYAVFCLKKKTQNTKY